MSPLRRLWVLGLAAAVLLVALAVALLLSPRAAAPDAQWQRKERVHLDHSAFFKKPFKTGEEVTQACLKCHPAAAHEVMQTAHWTWLGDKIQRPGMAQPLAIGKANLINNFCIGIKGNWASCTRCHAGYGWSDAHFDFRDQTKVDCLVCHDWSGGYIKGDAGEPAPGTDLLAAAQSVGYPKRENCGTCHYYGGGGLGVKHGDLDTSLDNPSASLDVHMGREKMLCIDCHRTQHHHISGRSFSVSVQDHGGISCLDCHAQFKHQDQRIERHTSALACQACHIPRYAEKVPTKMFWDWSQAGDGRRKENPHHYLKIKGQFVYGQDLVPEYHWFNGKVDRYLQGDPIATKGPTVLNPLHGDIQDPSARIWPFKAHWAKQPYDTVTRCLLVPVTGGPGGYWHNFNWDQALRLNVTNTGQVYSGHYGFAETVTYWPLSHMVTPKAQALRCVDCHGPDGRMDFKALGYPGDPALVGGRKP